MTTTALKNSLFLIIITLLALPATSFAQTAQVSPRSVLEKKSVDIGTLAGNETFRYGRELYRKGDYAQAAKVFQRILKVDCTSRLAQYHLQKIAETAPEFAYLKDHLNKLPCKQYDFNEDVFLPASFYFEKDTDLMLEQLEVYNNRYRNNKTTLAVKMAEYAAAARRLEERIREMTAELNRSKETDAKTINALVSQLSAAKTETASINTQLAELKQALARAAADRETTLGKKTAKAKAPKVVAKPTADTELTTLQEKFAAIQRRLQEIGDAIAEKNTSIQALQEGLGATNK